MICEVSFAYTLSVRTIYLYLFHRFSQTIKPRGFLILLKSLLLTWVEDPGCFALLLLPASGQGKAREEGTGWDCPFFLMRGIGEPRKAEREG